MFTSLTVSGIFVGNAEKVSKHELPALCRAGMTAASMLVSVRTIGNSSTDSLEISLKAVVFLEQVRHLVTKVGCKRPVLVARLGELAVIFDIRLLKPLNVGVLFILK